MSTGQKFQGHSDYFVLRKSDHKAFMINEYHSLSQEAVAY